LNLGWILRRLVLVLLGAALLIAALPGGDQWWAAFVGFIPLFLAVEGVSRGWALLLGWLAGFVWALWAVGWLLFLALSGFELSVAMSIGLVLGYVLLSLYLGLYYGLALLFFHSVWPRSRLLALLLTPCVWVCLEYVRGHLLTGFPWAFLSHTLYRKPFLIQPAAFGGAYLVSFLLLLANLSLYYVVKDRWRGSGSTVALAILWFLLCRLGAEQGILPAQEEPGLRVGIVQANIPQDVKNLLTEESISAIYRKHIDMTSEMLKSREKPQIVFWSESMVSALLNTERDAPVRESLRAFASANRVALCVGALGYEEGRPGERWKLFNSCYLFQPDVEEVQRYDKMHLVPFGEYVPLKRFLPFLTQVVPYEGGFTPGAKPVSFSLGSLGIGFGAVICYEDAYPEVCRDVLLGGARQMPCFLANLTNDGWFAKSWELEQHMACSVFRAVEFRVFVVRAANTGISAIIAPSGEIRMELPKNTAGTITGNVNVAVPLCSVVANSNRFALVCLVATVAGVVLLWGRAAQRCASR